MIVVKPVNNPESASILKRATGLDPVSYTHLTLPTNSLV